MKVPHRPLIRRRHTCPRRVSAFSPAVTHPQALAHLTRVVSPMDPSRLIDRLGSLGFWPELAAATSAWQRGNLSPEAPGPTPWSSSVGVTPLDALVHAVLSRGAEAALPSALPDAWLLAVVRDLRQLELAGDDVDVRSLALQSITLLVYAIASAPLPGGGDVESVGGSPALDRLQVLYRQAAFDELVSRLTGVARSPRPLPLLAIQAAALSSPPRSA